MFSFENIVISTVNEETNNIRFRKIGELQWTIHLMQGD